MAAATGTATTIRITADTPMVIPRPTTRTRPTAITDRIGATTSATVHTGVIAMVCTGCITIATIVTGESSGAYPSSPGTAAQRRSVIARARGRSSIQEGVAEKAVGPRRTVPPVFGGDEESALPWPPASSDGTYATACSRGW